MKQNLPDSKFEREEGETVSSGDTNGLMDEVEMLREELKKKDCQLEHLRYQLERRDKELDETTQILNDIARRRKIFYQFSLFPLEVRFLIYKQFSLFDRVSASQSSEEMETYFTKHPLKTDLSVYLIPIEGKVYVKMVFFNQKYIELHEVPQHLLPLIQEELNSFNGCKCEYCKDVYMKNMHTRCFANNNLDTVFNTMRLCVTEEVDIKSSTCEGLVDLFQPGAPLPKDPRYNQKLEVTLHMGEKCKRNDTRFNLENWRKWMDYWPFQMLWVSDISRKPPTFMHRDLFELSAIQNVEILSIFIKADINFHQLIKMKSRWICFEEYGDLRWLTPLDILEFYQAKIKEWLKDPTQYYYFCFHSAADPTNPPHMDYRRLLDGMSGELQPEDFRVYSQSDDDGAVKSITIRCMKTNQLLEVTKHQMGSESFEGYGFGEWLQHLDI